MGWGLIGSVNHWATNMEISVLCTDPNHPVVKSLLVWIADMSFKGHTASLYYDKVSLQGGDILFLVSCSQIIRDTERKKYRATLVLHASDLPNGRGWSPHVWSILNGANRITVCLLEAKDPVDSGAIWLKTEFALEGHELLPEINEKLFGAELSLMTQAVERIGTITPTAQCGDPGPYMPKRKRKDSRLDPNKTLAEQFNVLRVVDNTRYPAFFDYCGKRYLIKIDKSENE